MASETAEISRDGATALEHMTGPSRGTVTWLSGSTLDIYLRANRFLNVIEASSGEVQTHHVARLHRAEDSYEIQAPDDGNLWVNGDRIKSRKLANRDLIEFGQAGPLSRFIVHREDRPIGKMVTEIISDGLAYLRVSRQPVLNRVFRTVAGCVGALLRETTILFRFGVIMALGALALFIYQQQRLNNLLKQRIEMGSSRLEGFAGALARTRKQALTLSDLKTLRQEFKNRLSSAADRLSMLERRSQASARVIAGSRSSVVFLQGGYGFRERKSGKPLRHVVDPAGRPLISPRGQPLLTLTGKGPVAERKFTGTGFAIGDKGALITNRHAAIPWETDANIKIMIKQGLDPVMIRFIAYLPGRKTSISVELLKASGDADLAVLRLKKSTRPTMGLKLATAPPKPGDEVIVMGYPTGLRAMLAQSGKVFVEEVQKSKDTGFWSVAARLAEKGYVAPLASRGIVSQATATAIVYDAETTHGGSGGPVLDTNGQVVAVNAAILPEYGGSNLGVPIAKVLALLKQAGLR